MAASKGVTSSDFCFKKAALAVAQVDGEIRPGRRGTSSKDSVGILGTAGMCTTPWRSET